MKYVAVLRQDGGCDYTIGCGITTLEFEAENNIEAAKILKKIVFEDYNNSETILKSADFYNINEKFEVDIERWKAEFSQIHAIAALDDQRKKDMAELERIKKKYGIQ